MGTADLIILGVIAFSGLVGLWRGFISEVFSLFTWAAAFIVARLFSPFVDSMLVDTIEMPSLRMAVAFFLLFVGVLIIGGIVGKFIKMLAKATGLSGTDKVLGLVFGALRGVLIVTVLVALFRPMIEEDDWWQESTLAPHIIDLEGWTRETGAQLFEFFWEMEPSDLTPPKDKQDKDEAEARDKEKALQSSDDVTEVKPSHVEPKDDRKPSKDHE